MRVPNAYCIKNFSKLLFGANNIKCDSLDKKNIIGQIVTVSPYEGEKYYMRILSNYIRDTLSFDQLKTIDGAIASTFREVATMHGLLDRDSNLEDCFHETSLYQMPYSLRWLFATILVDLL